MDSITSALENVAADKGRICGSLYYIRSNVSNTLEGVNELRNHGGIKILVKCLKQVNPKVLSLALSILGNCSLNEVCREQLLEYGVIKDLGFIMKNINVDAIDNRTCRMIANLAISQAHIPIMYKNNIPSTIINILSNTKCDATRYSAIRALRKIWENSSKTGCAEMLKYQAVRIVSELLTSKCKEIVLAVLRAQASFLSNAANLKHPTNNLFVISQILGNAPENVNTIDTFMHLLPEQTLVSKIIYSMCKISQASAILNQASLIVRIIEVLKKENNHYLAISMCLLLECPLNRNRFIQTKDGISVFLDLISGTNSTQKELATNTLLSFQYSKDLLEILVKKGLISMLIKNLSAYLQANKIPHTFKIKSKSLDISSLVNCASPPGSSNMSPILPVRTSWTPPIDDSATDSYSPYYSPVCESFDNESLNADESKSDVSDYELEDDKNVEIPSSEKTGENAIIHLLANLSYIENIVKMMAVKEIWETILDYVQYIKVSSIHLSAIKILQKITQDVLNFKTILTDGFILSTHRRLCRPTHELELCKYCEEQNNLGIMIIRNSIGTFESKYAEDVMISIMNEPDTLTSNQNLKILVSVTIPLVIQCQPKQLIAMLSRYKVFENLCNIIRDDQNASYDDAIGALIALFETSNITYQKSENKLCEDRKCYKNIVKKETTVTLALDDGTQINANKSFLSLKSPMFEAMFRCGGFKEAYQKTIRLNDVSPECFKSFMRLLDVYCDCLLPKNINVLLELIMITDKYMLNELSEKIITVMINSMIVDNCCIIYEWAKESGYQLRLGSDVGLNVVRYLFSSNSRFPGRVEVIKKIFKSNYGQHFIEDLSIVLKNGLTSICGDDRVSEFYLRKFACELA